MSKHDLNLSQTWLVWRLIGIGLSWLEMTGLSDKSNNEKKTSLTWIECHLIYISKCLFVSIWLEIKMGLNDLHDFLENEWAIHVLMGVNLWGDVNGHTNATSSSVDNELACWCNDLFLNKVFA